MIQRHVFQILKLNICSMQKIYVKEEFWSSIVSNLAQQSIRVIATPRGPDRFPSGSQIATSFSLACQPGVRIGALIVSHEFSGYKSFLFFSDLL